MKICAIICEYNPFHNGHLHQLREAKRLSGADAVLCMMSGNFVQRGEAAIMEKYTRAKHAVQAGADIVVELPTVFATSNAELFAKGAVSLLSSIPAVNTLCFGAETANKHAFILAARYLNDEPAEVSAKIKASMQKGVSYAKARAQAWAGFIPFDILCSPNNILGLEYSRALLSLDSAIQILPIPRIGSNYNDDTLKENFSSASAIRTAIKNGEMITANIPEYVAKDLPISLETNLEILEKYALLSKKTEDIAKVCDCTEGLENALKKAAMTNFSLTEVLTSSRYTSSRIRRIALQNLLNIDEQKIRDCLRSPLYLRVLAVKKERNDVLSALSDCLLPLLLRAHDEDRLCDVAKQSFKIDLFAEKVYNIVYGISSTKKEIFL